MALLMLWKVAIKFDGVDLENPKILIDRKYKVTSQAKQIEGFKRQAECLRQNPDYRLRIEVPNEKVLQDTMKGSCNIFSVKVKSLAYSSS
jgi:hypothetical protein